MRAIDLHHPRRKLLDLSLLPLKNRFKSHLHLLKNRRLLFKLKKLRLLFKKKNKHPDPLLLLNRNRCKSRQLLLNNKRKRQGLLLLRNPKRHRNHQLPKLRSKPLAQQLPKFKKKLLAQQLPKPNSHKTTPTPQANPRQSKSKNPKRRSKTNDRILQSSK